MSDDDLIRRGDARRIALAYATSEGAERTDNAIAALPAVTVGVKPLVWGGVQAQSTASSWKQRQVLGSIA